MGEKKVRAVAAGFSCMDVYEKLNRCYPTGNGAAGRNRDLTFT